MFTYSQTYSMLFGMSRRAASIVLTPEEGSTLERWSRARSIPARLVQRARIVRLAARQTEPRHRRGVGYFSSHGATVAAAFLGASAGRTGKGRPSARTPAAYLSTKSTAGGGGDAAFEAFRCHPLEYADHGPGAGLERSLGAPDLEATPPQTSSDENLQAQPGPAVRRETAGCRGTVPESSGKSPGAVRR